MKILHSYCLNYNVGDYALGYGVKNILRRHLDVDLIAQTNLQGREFNRYYIDEVVNKRFDLLVIGGGGIIHGAHWPQGWFWLIESELISSIKIPWIVYGAGYNYFNDEEGIPDRGVEHLKVTTNQASFFSVRNDGSFGRLKAATGIEANVVPDPGFHVPMDRHWGAKVVGDFVVVQVADDKSSSRYRSREDRANFIVQLKTAITDIAKDFRVIAIPHVEHDIEISKEIVDGIDGAESLNFGSYAFDRCEEVMKYYRDARFVLAMRGHGQIVPIGFDTPVITFSLHKKIKGMMDSLGLEEFHVEMDDHLAHNIGECVKKIESDRNSVVSRLKDINASLESQTAKAMSAVSGTIS